MSPSSPVRPSDSRRSSGFPSPPQRSACASPAIASPMRAAGSIKASRANKRTHVMDLGITGKTALVLGAGGGLGGAIAKALAREGARVALGDIDPEALERAAEDIRHEGGTALTLAWDLADLSLLDDRVRTIEEQLGSVDILVNNTGGPPPTPAAGQDPELWSRSFQSMVLSVIALTDRVLPGMRERSGAASSPAPLRVSSRRSPISASRTRCGSRWSAGRRRWHGRLARDGITANIVLPGRIATPRITFLDEQKARREGRAVEGGRGRKRRLDSRWAATAGPRNTAMSSPSSPASARPT